MIIFEIIGIATTFILALILGYLLLQDFHKYMRKKENEHDKSRVITDSQADSV